MTELIKITEQNGKKVVSARELYEFLEVNSNFPTWAKRMFEYGFEEGKDFIPFLEQSTGGRPSKDYAITLDAAKEISMLQRSEKGKQARQYFIECERKVNEIIKPQSVFDMLSIGFAQMAQLEKSQQESLVRLTTLEETVKEVKAKQTTSPADYYTVAGYASILGLPIDTKRASVLGRKATKSCKTDGYEVSNTHDPRFGFVNVYPKVVLEPIFRETYNI